MVRALRRKGNDRVRLTEFEDVGHDALGRVYGNDRVYDWMLQQRFDGS